MSELDLAPTADIPTARMKKPNPVCDAPCPTCGERVLTGTMRDGQVLSVDLEPRPIYCVVWHKPDELPTLDLSGTRGYVVHRCRV